MPNSEPFRLNVSCARQRAMVFCQSPATRRLARSRCLIPNRRLGRRLRFISHGLGEPKGIGDSSYLAITQLMKLGHPGELTHELVRFDRSGHRACRSLEPGTQHTRFPDRRPGREGRRPRAAASGQRRGARARGGRSLSATTSSKRSRGCWVSTFRSARRARSRPWPSSRVQLAGIDGRRDFAQRRRAWPQGHHGRRCRRHPEGRRDHSSGRPWRPTRARGPRPGSSSQDLPELRGARRAVGDEVAYYCTNPLFALSRAAQGVDPLVRPSRCDGY